MAGKGDAPRPMEIPWDQYAENFDRIFGKEKSEGYQVPPHRSGGCMDNLRGKRGSKETE